MKIQYFSDIHLEGNTPAFLKDFKPIGDVLVLAGDITNWNNVHRLDYFFGSLGIPVIYILGNHEYYYQDRVYTVEMYKKYLKARNSNITLLENESVRINNVNFHGGTLWCDISPLQEIPVRELISDFYTIGGLTPNILREENAKTVGYIKYAMQQARARGQNKNIVVTHFAPSFQAQEPRFRDSAVGSYFYNKLDDLILNEEPDIWIYGHTHGNLDFDIEKTKVVTNQHGYKREPANHTFNHEKIIEI